MLHANLRKKGVHHLEQTLFSLVWARGILNPPLHITQKDSYMKKHPWSAVELNEQEIQQQTS